MAQDKDYIKSLKLWIKGQKTLIEEMKSNRDYLLRDIEIKKSSVEIMDETLIHESNQLDKVRNILAKYKKAE